MNRLIGMLCVGSHKEGEALTGEDVAFMESLMPQAGIALENALLYREQRERYRRMLRADRLATIGELAAGAAHEIRNPLTSIKSSIQYLETKSSRADERKLLRTALQETARIDEILSALLSFSRPSAVENVRHDLIAILELQGYRNAYAGITLPIPPSVVLHELMGFMPVGVYHEIGYKLGAWHDVGWWHLALGERGHPPDEPRAMAANI